MSTLDYLKSVMMNKTLFETYIVTIWFVLLTMFNVAVYWIYIPTTFWGNMTLTLIYVYVSYNMLKTYTHTRSIILREEDESILE